MKPPNTAPQQTAETVQELLDVVTSNRDRRCGQLLEDAHARGRAIVGRAYARSRARMHRHISALREKYRVRVTATIARNETLLRQQHQQTDRAALAAAWPRLHDALLALWQHPASRRRWIDAAITGAASQLRDGSWRIEHPGDLDQQELRSLLRTPDDNTHEQAVLSAADDIDGGLRVRVGGTVFDASIEGLLRQKTAIESSLIAGIRRGAPSDD